MRYEVAAAAILWCAMSNLVANPSFEVPDTGSSTPPNNWALDFDSGANRGWKRLKWADTAPAYLTTPYNIFGNTIVGGGPGSFYATSDAFAVADGEWYTVVFYRNNQSGNAEALSIEADRGDGVWTQLGVWTNDTGFTYQKARATFKANGTSAQIRFAIPRNTATLGAWLIDDVYLERTPKVITKLLRDAILADLGTISVANGYEITVAEVYSEPILTDQRTFPFLELVPSEGGESEDVELGARGGETRQTFRVRGGCSSGTPLTDLMALLDSVRNSIEKSTSSVCGLSSPKVITAAVTNWETTLADDAVAAGVREFVADIDVTYSYVRGSA